MAPPRHGFDHLNNVVGNTESLAHFFAAPLSNLDFIRNITKEGSKFPRMNHVAVIFVSDKANAIGLVRRSDDSNADDRDGEMMDAHLITSFKDASTYSRSVHRMQAFSATIDQQPKLKFGARSC